MLDPVLLRSNIDIISKKLALRSFKIDINTFKEQEKRRKILQIETENLQYKCNLYSKKISDAQYNKQNINIFCQKIYKIKQQLIIAKLELKKIQNYLNNYILSLPNIPSDEVPFGLDKNSNKEIFRWGEPYNYNFPIKDHVELGKIINGIDFPSAVKITGSRFIVMRGQIAQLHRALIQFMLDLHTEKHNYTEYYLPYLVNNSSLYGSGQLPKFYKDIFYVQTINKHKEKSFDYALIPTAEIPLVNLLRDKIIDEHLLPLKMVAHTPCFRSEAGSYGKDTHGLIRMHQFDKVEVVQIVKPKTSMKVLEEITNHAEQVLQLLKLPYRKILLCSGDMAFTSCKTYDLEVWFPSQNTYREISSCSNIGDFQARRIKARYRNKKDKKLYLVHTLNGSSLAVGRTLAAILENYQIADGRIKVPDVLNTYMHGLNYIN